MNADETCRCEVLDPTTEGGGTDPRSCPVHAYELGRRHERMAYLEERAALEARVVELATQLNTPELHDFAQAVVLEAAHQRARWGSDHDAGKTPADWFWLIGYLAGKALHRAEQGEGDPDKCLHHIITTAAVCANWHAAIEGTHTRMRPGILPSPEVVDETAEQVRPMGGKERESE